MPMTVANQKQNLTIRLDRETIRKAKILAAKQSTSISALVAEQVDKLIGEDDAYEQAMKRSLALMKQGFHMGGVHNWDRDSLHDRAALRER
jgi:predicted transcriptional regulator